MMFPRALHRLFTAASLAVPVAAAAQGNSVFLQVEHAGRVSWVLGVLDLNDHRLMGFSDDVFDVIGNAGAVHIMTPSCEEALGGEAFPYLGKGNVETLYDNRSFLELDAVCRTYLNQSAWSMVRLQPLALRSIIEYEIAHAAGGSPAQEQLAVIAREQGKLVVTGLTPSLCSAIETVPVALQADMLMTIVNRHVDGDYAAALTKLYLDGNIEGLARIAERAEHVEYRIQLCEPWIESIVAAVTGAETDSMFFIVDATLLGGREGIAELLAAAGAEVEYLRSGLSYIGPVNSSNPWLTAALFSNEGSREITYHDIGSTYGEERLDSILPRWYELVSYAGGFNGRLPLRPSFSMERRPVGGDYLTVHLFKCEDLAVNSFHTFSYSNYPQSFRVTGGGQDFFQQIVDSAVSKIRGVLLSNIDISVPPVRAREIEIEVEDEFIVRSRFYLIDNRFYQVMLGTSKRSAYSEKENAFLNSLRIMDQKSEPWHTVNLGLVRAEVPSPPERDIATLGSGLYSFNYSATDEHTGLQYTISYTPYSPGTTNKPVNELYDGMVHATVSSLRGTMLSDGPFLLNGYYGREVEIAVRENTYCRIRFFMKDHRLVQLIVSGEGESIYSTYAERFLNSLVLIAGGG